jgi:hypothetical protein
MTMNKCKEGGTAMTIAQIMQKVMKTESARSLAAAVFGLHNRS